MSVDLLADEPHLSTPVEALILLSARGDHDACVALQDRMIGLVRLNVRRVLRDASRCEAVTQEMFDEVLADAIHFDPHRTSALTWLLTRAHQHATDGLMRTGSTDDADDADDADGADGPELAPSAPVTSLDTERSIGRSVRGLLSTSSRRDLAPPVRERSAAGTGG